MSTLSKLCHLFSRFGHEFDSVQASAPAPVAECVDFAPAAAPQSGAADPNQWPVDYIAARADLDFLREFVNPYPR